MKRALGAAALLCAMLCAAGPQALGADSAPASPTSAPPRNGAKPQLHMAYQYMCLNTASWPKIGALKAIGDQDLHACDASSPGIYVARCRITYPDGREYQENINAAQTCDHTLTIADYQGPVPQYECDYLHALEVNKSEKAGFSLQAFNGEKPKPPLRPYSVDQQREFLAQEYCATTYVYRRYHQANKQSDPYTAFKLAKYFYWEKMPPASYVTHIKGHTPLSWYPYALPMWLQDAKDHAQEAKATKSVARVIKRLQFDGTPGHGDFLPQLAAAIDGDLSGKTGAVAKKAVAADLIAAEAKTEPGSADYYTLPKSLFSRLASPPLPPLNNPEDVKKENFGARGLKAALNRLFSFGKIAAWHYTGYSKTIGRPEAALQYEITQKNGTCGVESQYEALMAHGIKVNPADLANLAHEHGWYWENDPGVLIEPNSGTWNPYENKLLSAYGLPSTLIYHATPADLKKSIIHGGGAIVAVSAEMLWNDKPGPIDHDVYVSGAEVRYDGKILGYYINDTGTGEGMRFVPADRFNLAWMRPHEHPFMVSLDPKARPPKAEVIAPKEFDKALSQ